MAGYSKLYVIGGQGGYMGADGVNPIDLLLLVGDADRQWLEPHYFDQSLRPLGGVKVIVPDGPDHPDSLVDACIAFYPQQFRACPSFTKVESGVRDLERLDFDLSPQEIPTAWPTLREEARPIFDGLNIWRADLKPVNPGECG